MGKGDQESGAGRGITAPTGGAPKLRHHRRAALLAGVLTLIWFALYGWHVADAIGLENLQQLLPAELAQVIIAFSAPAAFIWVVIGYITRGHDLERHTALLAQQFSLLTYANPQAEQRVANVAEAIRRQTAELKNATEDAAAALSQIEGRFQHQRGDLVAAADAARDQARDVEAQLEAQRQLLAEMQAALAAQKDALKSAGIAERDALDRLAAEAADRVATAFDARRADIVAIIDRILDHGSEVRDAIERQAEILAEGAEKATLGLRNELLGVGRRLDEAGEAARREGRALAEAGDRQLASVDEIFARVTGEMKQQQDRLAADISLAVEAGKRGTAEAAAALRQVTEDIAAQATRHAGDLGEQLARQVGSINAAKEQALGAGEDLQAALAAQAAGLAQRTNEAFSLMRGEIATEISSIKAAEEQAEARYRSLADNLAGHVAELARTIAGAEAALGAQAAREQAQLEATAAATQTRVDAVLGAIEQQSKEIHDQADSSAERFASTLRRHHELVSATATATVGEVMRKTAEIQRQMREEGDQSVAATKAMAEDFIASLGRVGEIVTATTEQARQDNAALEELARQQAERLTHAALMSATQFRHALDQMSGETGNMIRALIEKIGEHNLAMKNALRSESADFRATASEIGEQIGARFSGLIAQIDSLSGQTGSETARLVATVDAQAGRLAEAADAASLRLQ
ncbi:MAG: hypothetical protein JNL25_11425, partial [Rhodospirillaceae bacterium]|nr:hypothetical protein [Rhodospirillaceae bacterium]